MDFRMEMQERIDNGMDPMEAYYDARDCYAGYSDFRDAPSVSRCDSDERCDCTCTAETDCECKEPVNEVEVVRHCC